jgi:lycopene beta-cyclase
MLAYKMAKSGKFTKDSILLIDKDLKNKNDRTWCFWEEETGDWNFLVSNKWKHCTVDGEWYAGDLDLTPFTYKMIKGLDFYSYIRESLNQYQNVTFVREEIKNLKDVGDVVEVETTKNAYQGRKVFSSLVDKQLLEGQVKYPVLQQHFVGWFVKTKEAVFTPAKATFMDFDLPQQGNTRFMYVLPSSSTEALVEYTLFSEQLLPTEDYENAIQEYLKNLGVSSFEILEKEKGAIPMTAVNFYQNNSKNVLHIGTSGGWTKASTGFTFSNINKKTNKLVESLNKSTDLSLKQPRTRFWYYDLLMLDVLHKHNYFGTKLFGLMFKRNTPYVIFKFLNEESSLLEELKIISSLPPLKFVSALFSRIRKKIFF